MLGACTGELNRASSEGQQPIDRIESPNQGNTSDTSGKPGTPDMSDVPGLPGMPNQQFEARTFSCDDMARREDTPLRRLSQEHYRNTLRDMIAYMAPGARGEQLFAGIDATIEGVSFPKEHRVGAKDGQIFEEKHGGFRRLDQRIIGEFIEISLAFATTIAAEVTRDDTALEALMGHCAVDADVSNDDDCVDDFIIRLGERALRMRVNNEDRSFYRAAFDDANSMDAGAQAVVTLMLTAPQFLYFVEHGTQPVEGKPDAFELGAYELASRLSYHFWQTMPDEELLAAARSGALLDEEIYRAQVERVVSDPRTASSLRTFFKEWLWLDELPELDGSLGNPAFDAFVGTQRPSPELRESMIAEIQDLAIYHTLEADSTFEEFFTSNLSVTQDPELASIYGVPVHDAQAPLQELPGETRAGLITRAGVVATGSHFTRPIIKGYFMRRALLCTTPPPPPPGNLPNPEPSDFETTREVVERLTEDPNTTCQGCHQVYINGLGFGLEGFDALGRERTHEELYNTMGEITMSKPVDTSSIPRIWVGDMRTSSGARDLSQMLIDSHQVHACFVQHYWRFALGQPEDEMADGCGLEALRAELVQGASMRDMMIEVAMRPEFRMRRLPASTPTP